MSIQSTIIKDETELELGKTSAQLLSLEECLKKNCLISPNSKEILFRSGNILSDGDLKYQIKNGCPFLYPIEILDQLNDDGTIGFDFYQSSIVQYALISSIKQFGEINSSYENSFVKKHLFRFHDFCKDLKGTILDVGSDLPSRSAKLFPEKSTYLGLDPYAGGGEFRVVGLGEILPFVNNFFDNVIFNTSLDHILDYHTAIEEAHRVLAPNGKIIIETNAWIKKATLLTDNVHFHHFREHQITGALEPYFHITSLKRYEDVKHRPHLYSLFVQGQKK